MSKATKGNVISKEVYNDLQCRYIGSQICWKRIVLTTP